MRRSRIKAIATVPVRRKILQETASVEPAVPSENLEREKDTDEKNTAEKTVDDKRDSETVYQNLPVQINPIVEPLCSDNNEKIDTKEIHMEGRHEGSKSIEQVNSVENYNNITEAASPTKVQHPVQSRLCFMRPTPKLDNTGRIRRNSVQGSGASASESEDDSRRTTVITNRIRNDSICSLQSVKETPVSVSQNNNLTRLKTHQKRRMYVSESAKKLAEARREFLLKQKNKTPDRSKLTMYDLLYYNPTTNPMKKSSNDGAACRRLSISQSEEIQKEREEEENEDDPSAMPVPQVKVGPDGQLIIDEKSLVIEQTVTKKNKEDMCKEAIVDNDLGGKGFYKRRKKSKEWTKWETLKFYKALNTVGTDFLLIKNLFPNRTREEIKLKYKKEEKINRKLIEKALRYHQEFDTEKLEQELAKFEAEVNTFEEKRKSVETKEKQKKYTKRRIMRHAASSIAEEAVSEDEEIEAMKEQLSNTDSEIFNEQIQPKGRKRSRQSSKKLTDEQLSDNDIESQSSHNSGSDTEVYQVRPTRSGRLPKIRKLQGPEVNTLDNNTEDCSAGEDNELESDDKLLEEAITPLDNNNKHSVTSPLHTIQNVFPDIDQVEPGSLVILSKESVEQPGETVLQVYMVSSSVNKSNGQTKPDLRSVELPSDLSSTVSPTLPNAEVANVKKECE